MRYILILSILISLQACGTTQNLDTMTSDMITNKPLPYDSIPDYPDNLTQGLILARLIDGLGYRFYWATDSLEDTTLNYQISPDSRSAIETLEHVHGMSNGILNVFKRRATIRSSEKKATPEWSVMRAETLINLKAASDIAKTLSDEEVALLKIVFKRGESESVFPLWNLINGQISDALTHVGQIVSYRRASGNPIDPRVNVFRGKNRD